jgi:6-phosphogluconolactonase
MRHRMMAGLGIVLALFAFAVPVTAAAHEVDRFGAVYTMTNAASGNAVLAYARAADGRLSMRGTYITGGLGTGSVLASQGAVTLSSDGRWLAVVDAGSSDVALFAVGPDGSLQLTDRVGTGGTDPISVTIHGLLVYVLDAGGSGGGNIAGFIRVGGRLFALPGSVRPLSGAGTSPEEIAFSSDGATLVVAEKGANDLVTYRVGFLGVASPPTAYPSAGATPYGFAFDGAGHAFVSEAEGSALSSYTVSPAGVPNVISASVGNGQLAACWVALTPDGRTAFTVDAHNAAISSYAIASDGSLTLLDGTAVLEAATSVPLLDASVSGDGRFLYVVDVGAGSIDGFRIGPGGRLSAIGSASGLPAGSGGMAAS